MLPNTAMLKNLVASALADMTTKSELPTGPDYLPEQKKRQKKVHESDRL